MNVNLTCVMLVLDTETNPDIRKNDIQKIKVLMQHGTCALPRVIANTSDDIKHQVRGMLRDIVGTDLFHLEQVYALGDKKYMSDNSDIDIIHLAIINQAQIDTIQPEYELADISIHDNTIKIGKTEYKYHTIEKVGISVEYLFETNAPDLQCDKTLIEILTTWKYLRGRLNNTDTIFKFMPTEFSPEDVRQVYEIISGRNVDKSNFHKKITKYCTPVPDKTTCRGHRPGKVYQYKAKNGDAWL